MNPQAILKSVQDQYGAVARSGLSSDSAAIRSVAQVFGYTPEDLASLPPQANMGLSCGNPVALAGLREGEVVVDLGCGGGLDVLLAAQRVGPTGRAIGIDMTPEMLERARAGAAEVGATNVEFHLAQIDHLPLPDASVDCILSNCVINLVPDKAQAFREILRVLKPGGRMVVSDIALKQPLPAEVVQDVQAYVGCIAGAILIAEYERLLRAAGFEAVVVQDTGADLNAYAQAGSGGCCSSPGCCTPDSPAAEPSTLHDGLADVLTQFNGNDYAASVRVHALKPVHDARDPDSSSRQETFMTTIEVYDNPTCCSTGVCGPDGDPVLTRFAADLEWLRSQGHRVSRYNLTRQPEAFIENPPVRRELTVQGATALPIVVRDGEIVSRGTYPSRGDLVRWIDSARSVVRSQDCCGGPPHDSAGACCARDEELQESTGAGCGCQTAGCC
jgi:SAM-dependent methyltransferase